MTKVLDLSVHKVGEWEEERKRKWREAYEKYLASDAWQVKRARVIERAGGATEGKCERCERSVKEFGWFEVHHKTYRRLGWEWLRDLEALCPKCHREIHGIKEGEVSKEGEGAFVRIGEEYVV